MFYGAITESIDVSAALGQFPVLVTIPPLAYDYRPVARFCSDIGHGRTYGLVSKIILWAFSGHLPLQWNSQDESKYVRV